MVKLIIAGLRFYFHYNFFLCKRPSFFLILKHFLKLRFFQHSGFFFKLRFFSKLRVFLENSDVFKPQGFFFKTQILFENQVFYCLEQCACHISADHDCWLKENEHDGIDDQNGFYLFYASCSFRW